MRGLAPTWPDRSNSALTERTLEFCSHKLNVNNLGFIFINLCGIFASPQKKYVPFYCKLRLHRRIVNDDDDDDDEPEETSLYILKLRPSLRMGPTDDKP